MARPASHTRSDSTGTDGNQNEYPLVYPARRRTRGFFLAFALCAFVWCWVPFFWGYAVWYLVRGDELTGWKRIPAGILFFYSCIENAFNLYLLFVSTYIQQPAAPSDLTSEQSTALLMRVLQSGLAGRRAERMYAGAGAGGAADGGDEGETDDIFADAAIRDEGHGDGEHARERAPTGETETESTGGSPYNLRRRTAKKEDPDYIVSSPTRKSRTAPPPPVAIPPPRASSSTSSRTRPAAPPLHRNATDAATQTRRDLLSAELADQIRSVLSGEGYTFASDLSASRASRAKKKSRQDSLRDEAGGAGSISPDIRLSRLDRDDPRAIEFRERIRPWFGNVPFEHITRKHVLEWLCWSSYCIRLEAVSPHSASYRMLEDSLGLVEARCGWVFPTAVEEAAPPGAKKTRSKVRLMRLTIDKVNIMSRPLFMYTVPACFNWYLKRKVYAKMGMLVYREGPMEYLMRLPPGWKRNTHEPRNDPILYLHGLGFGLLQNHYVIKDLIEKLPTHPIMIPLQPFISMQIFHPRQLVPFSRQETITSIKLACRRWGFYDENKTGEDADDGIVVMSHSNGSVSHGWLLKDCPTLARRNAFVDPVVFCVWEGRLCENFCYREPRTAIEILLYYFIASEIGIANSIQRYFDWSTNTLFFEEVPNARDETKTAYWLGGRDAIIDAPRVKAYLNRHGVHSGIQMDMQAGHGDGLSGPALDRLIVWLRTGRIPR